MGARERSDPDSRFQAVATRPEPGRRRSRWGRGCVSAGDPRAPPLDGFSGGTPGAGQQWPYAATRGGTSGWRVAPHLELLNRINDSARMSGVTTATIAAGAESKSDPMPRILEALVTTANVNATASVARAKFATIVGLPESSAATAMNGLPSSTIVDRDVGPIDVANSAISASAARGSRGSVLTRRIPAFRATSSSCSGASRGTSRSPPTGRLTARLSASRYASTCATAPR